MKTPTIGALVLAACLPLAAQSAPQTGINRWGSYKSFLFGVVDRGDLNSHFEIPLYTRATVGGAQVRLRLTYDSQFWAKNPYSQWQPAAGWGWQLGQADGQLATSEQDQIGVCGWYDPNNPQDGDDGTGDIYNFSYTFYEPDGTPAPAGGLGRGV